MSMSDFSCELMPMTMNRLSDDSGWSITGALATFGKRVRLGQPLGDDLARLEDVGARLEDQHDRGEPGDRLGADLVEERDAVEQVRLERDGDELLDLFGRQAERLGLDLDVRAA